MREAARAELNRVLARFGNREKTPQGREQQGCSLKARLSSQVEGKQEPRLDAWSLCLLTPSLRPRSAEWPGQGPEPQQSRPAGRSSHLLQIVLLSTASATDIAEVLLEMGVNKRLQESAR